MQRRLKPVSRKAKQGETGRPVLPAVPATFLILCAGDGVGTRAGASLA